MISGASLLVAAATVGLGFYGIPLLTRAVSVSKLNDRCREGRALVLTYDDGPSEVLTPALLDILKDISEAATFFPKGVAAAGGRNLLDRIAGAGHEIGCHSHSHRHAWKVPPPIALRDALAGFETLSRWVPADGLYRPPYGKIDLLTSVWLARRGIEQAWWTIDSGDTWNTLPAIEETIERVRAGGGGVILMHDMHQDPVRQRYVLGLTERLVALIESGEFVGRSFSTLNGASSTDDLDATRSAPA